MLITIAGARFTASAAPRHAPEHRVGRCSGCCGWLLGGHRRVRGDGSAAAAASERAGHAPVAAARAVSAEGGAHRSRRCGTALRGRHAVAAARAGAGFWWALFDRERLTWHDRASERGCCGVRKSPSLPSMAPHRRAMSPALHACASGAHARGPHPTCAGTAPPTPQHDHRRDQVGDAEIELVTRRPVTNWVCTSQKPSANTMPMNRRLPSPPLRKEPNANGTAARHSARAR